MSGDTFSIVEFLEEHEGYRCGYCKSTDGNYSQGMWAHELRPGDYQDLIDRGWRRSGKYCYKPSMSIMCCPSYTIKCAVEDFKMSKSQKKVLKNFTKFLASGVKGKAAAASPAEEQGSTESSQIEDLPAAAASKAAAATERGEGDADAAMKSATSSVENLPTASVKKEKHSTDQAVEKKPPAKGLGADPNKPKCAKAKTWRKEKKMAKMRKSGGEKDTAPDAAATDAATTSAAAAAASAPTESNGKSLEDLVEEAEKLLDPNVKFEMKLIKSNPPSPEFEETFEESFQLYKKYQMVIHNDDEDKLSVRQYKRFLCHSPLFPADSGDDSHPFGSYHQHYYVDGRLIAVGVIDILPSCVSSVYLFYDPDFHFLTLGTYAALREVYFTRRLSRVISSLKFYYMGFYIHSCPKMRYKGAFAPSFLLCPEVNTWHRIEDCRPKLDGPHKYSRFNEDAAAEDETRFSGEVNKVKILHKGFPMTYGFFREYKETNDEEQVRRYAGFVGKSAEKILLYRD